MQDYGFRLYNPAIGKFLSVDPITMEYPELTPYQFASNRPMQGTDLDGLEFADSKGSPLGPISVKALTNRQDAGQYTYSTGKTQTFYPTIHTVTGLTIKMNSIKYTNYKFKMGNNNSPFEKVKIREFELNVSVTGQSLLAQIDHQALVYDADGDADLDGPNKDQDVSGAAAWSTSLNSGIKSPTATTDETEKNHWTWSLDGTKDIFTAIPTLLKNDFNVKYGDIVAIKYKAMTQIGTVADGSGGKIGEISGYALLSFGVNHNQGQKGISTKNVRYMIFKNTSAGETTYPTIQNDASTKAYIEKLSDAIDTGMKNDKHN